MKKYLQAASTAKLVACALFLFVFSACKKNELNSLNGIPPVTMSLSEIKVDSVFQMTEIASAEKERARLQQRYMHSDFSETGFYLEPNGTVKINVDVNEGTRTPTLIIGTLSRYYSFGSSDAGGLAYVKLKPGQNEIKDVKGKGGLLFLQFANSYNYGVQKCTVKFLSGMLPVPYFKLGKTTNEEWRAMLSYFNNVPDVVLSTHKAMIVVSLKNAYTNQKENLEAFLPQLDAVYDAYDSFSGMTGSNERDQPNIHKVLMTEMDRGPAGSGFMFTTNKRTAFRYDNVNKLLTESAFKSIGGYGVWHEMGHTYQMSAWNWSTTVEASVQLYAFRAMRAIGGFGSEMSIRNVWPKVIRFVNDTNPAKDFNNNYADYDSNIMSYWVRFGLFYQLWLQYGDDFYAKLHQYYREFPQSGFTNEERMSNFMYIASKVSGNDLTNFFKKWGFKLVDKEYQRVKSLALPAPDKDITALTD